MSPGIITTVRERYSLFEDILSSLKNTFDNSGLLNSPTFARVFGISLLFVMWVILALNFPEDLMPFPHQVLTEIIALISSGSALTHVSATLTRAVLGFLCAVLFGLVLGVSMGASNYFEGIFTPYALIGLSVPGLAWAAAATLVFGFNILAPIAAVVAIVFPYIAINSWKGIESIESDLVKMSNSFNVSNGRMILRLFIPNAAPSLFAAARFGIAVSWNAVVVTEIFASSAGVGYMLITTYEAYRYAEVWAWAALFMFIILFTEYVILKPLERRVFSYRSDADFDLV